MNYNDDFDANISILSEIIIKNVFNQNISDCVMFFTYTLNHISSKVSSLVSIWYLDSRVAFRWLTFAIKSLWS